MSDAFQIKIARDLSQSNIADAAGLARALLQVMKNQNQLTVAHIVQRYANFPSDQPTTMEGLRHISGLLARSYRATDPQITATGISSEIGSNMVYAAIHEYGGIIERMVLAGSVRLRLDVHGNLLRNGNLAVFAKDEHKRVLNVPYAGGKRYGINIPARAPVQRGIADRISEYGPAMDEAIGQFLKK
jgi:phage gpG-like protein